MVIKGASTHASMLNLLGIHVGGTSAYAHASLFVLPILHDPSSLLLGFMRTRARCVRFLLLSRSMHGILDGRRILRANLVLKEIHVL